MLCWRQKAALSVTQQPERTRPCVDLLPPSDFCRKASGGIIFEEADDIGYNVDMTKLMDHWIFPIAVSEDFPSHIAALETNPIMPVRLSVGDLSIDWRQTVPAEAFRGGELIHVGVIGGKLEKVGVAIILDCQKAMMLDDGAKFQQAVIDEGWWLKRYPGGKPIGHVNVDSSSIRIEVSAGRAALQVNVFTIYGDGEYPIYPITIEDIGHGFFIDFE